MPHQLQHRTLYAYVLNYTPRPRLTRRKHIHPGFQNGERFFLGHWESVPKRRAATYRGSCNTSSVRTDSGRKEFGIEIKVTAEVLPHLDLAKL